MMRSIAVLFLIVALSLSAQAQTPACPNTIYLEFLGNGIYYSVNYDRLFSESFGARVGMSYIFPLDENIYTFPITGQYLVNWGSSKLELGLGLSIIIQPENVSFSWMSAPDEEIRGNSVLGTATIGYRYQADDGGFVFRIGLTPFFGTFIKTSDEPYVTEEEKVFGFRIHGGISLGYAF